MRKMLMLTDREEISRGLAESLEYQEIGHRLGRDSSVISREVARHGGRARYRAAAAHEAARAGRERPKLFAVERSARLRAVVCRQLRQGWSPASIAGRLPTEYAADESCRVSARARRSRMGMTTRSIRGGALRPCGPISPQRSATPGTWPSTSVATICPAYR